MYMLLCMNSQAILSSTHPPMLEIHHVVLEFPVAIDIATEFVLFRKVLEIKCLPICLSSYLN